MSLKDQLIKPGSKEPSLRKHLRPILDQMTKQARRHEIEEGDRVKVTDGQLEGLVVTVYEIKGRDAMVSATAHGRKSRVPLEYLAPLETLGRRGSRRKRKAKRVKTNLFFSPFTGKVQELRQSRVVNTNDVCPFCMKKLRGTPPDELVALNIDDYGSEGAHYACARSQM